MSTRDRRPAKDPMPVKLPDHDESEWVAAGFSAADAQALADASVPLAEARRWSAAGIDACDVADYVEKTVPLDEAVELEERGIELWQITRTDSGYEVELEPWQRDPLEHLPKVIAPGRFGLSVWSVTPWDGEHLENEVSLDWGGQSTVEWSVLSGSGLSVMSEVSFRGIAGWPDGRNLEVTYSGDDGNKGYQWLPGAAPCTDGRTVTSPEGWLAFATTLVGMTEELLDSGIEPQEQLTDYYLRCEDEEPFEFDDMFRLYLTESASNKTLPDFGEWMSQLLEQGVYQIHD